MRAERVEQTAVLCERLGLREKNNKYTVAKTTANVSIENRKIIGHLIPDDPNFQLLRVQLSKVAVARKLPNESIKNQYRSK